MTVKDNNDNRQQIQIMERRQRILDRKHNGSVFVTDHHGQQRTGKRQHNISMSVIDCN